MKYFGPLYHRSIDVYLGRRSRYALMLAQWTFPEADEPKEDHVHAHHIEFHYTVRGSQRYILEGKTYIMRAGDVLIALPGERHGTGKYPIEKRQDNYIRIDMTDKERILGLHPHIGGPIYAALSGLARRHFRMGLAPSLPLKRFFAGKTTADDAMRNTAAVSAVLEFLTAFIDAVRQPQHAAEHVVERDGGMREIIRYIERSQERTLPIAGLAARAGLSVAHFRSVFKDATGMPVHDYIMRSRIRKAKRLIETTDRPIIDIAYELGFSSSQYFATVFKRYTGKKPVQFR